LPSGELISFRASTPKRAANFLQPVWGWSVASRMAAPIAAKAADFYLRRKYGIPIDTIQTLAEHYAAGVPAPWARQ